MQVNGTSSAAGMYGTQSGAQPVTYSPQVSSAYGVNDQYQSTQKSGGGLFGGEQKQYVTRQSVMMGAAGAGIGFLVGGPWGALIGGVIGLLISVLGNIFKGGADNNAPKPVPTQMAQPMYQQNYPQTTSQSDAYYAQLQQQQMMQQR